MLKHYTKARAAKLKRLKISDIDSPIRIKIYWLNSSSSDTVSQELHKHTFYEAHFVLEGSMHYQDKDGTIFDLSCGNGILFAPHFGHSLISSSPDLLRFSITFLPLDVEFAMPTQCFSITDTLIQCMDTILYEVDQKSILSPSLVQNRIFEILCELFRLAGVDKPFNFLTEDNSEDLIIAKAKQYIADNKETMLECKDVAAHCHFNAQYISRIFLKRTGVSLLEYIHGQKMEQAEELLGDSSLSLKQISVKLGFANEYYFNTFFKRRNGISPGEFRKLLCK